MTRSRTTVGGLTALALLAAACTSSAGGTSAPAATGGLAPTPASTASPTVAPTPTPDPAAFVLGEYGPYHVGTQQVSTTDAARSNRRVGVTVWYPAVQPAGFQGPGPSINAEPDPGGGPYPLILSSTTMARRLAPIVVSHGFAWASVDNIDTYRHINPEMVEQPRDIVAALDLVATSPPPNLRGMIDTDRAGAIGYSFDGYNAYALGGARIDPRTTRRSARRPTRSPSPSSARATAPSQCLAPEQWDKLVARAGEVAVAGSDGLWQPMTDERIRAVMPMAGEGWWLFGERGLAAFDRPALVIAATDDELYAENVLMFRHLGTATSRSSRWSDRAPHRHGRGRESVAFAHFATAFFGHRLRGRDDYARYYSKESVDLHPELRWGVPDEE